MLKFKKHLTRTLGYAVNLQLNSLRIELCTNLNYKLVSSLS